MLSTLDTTCTYRWQLILKCCFKPGWIGGPRAVEFGGDTITDLSLLAGRLLGSSLLAAVRLSIFSAEIYRILRFMSFGACQAKRADFGHWVIGMQQRTWNFAEQLALSQVALRLALEDIGLGKRTADGIREVTRDLTRQLSGVMARQRF